MQKLDYYPPGGVGHCKLCKTGVTPVIDTEREYDEFYAGRLYVCSNCGNEIARLLGWTDEAHYNEKFDEVEILHSRIDEIAEELSAVTEENAKLRSLLAAQLNETPENEAPARRRPGRPRKSEG